MGGDKEKAVSIFGVTFYTKWEGEDHVETDSFSFDLGDWESEIIVECLSKLSQYISEEIDPEIEALWDTLYDALDTLEEIVDPFIDWTKIEIDKIWDLLEFFDPEWKEWVIDEIEDLGGSLFLEILILSGLTETADSLIKEALEEAVETIESQISDLGEYITQALDMLKEDYDEIVNSRLKDIKEKVDGALARKEEGEMVYTTELKQDVEKERRNIAQDIKSAIREHQRELESYVSGVEDEKVEWLRNRSDDLQKKIDQAVEEQGWVWKTLGTFAKKAIEGLEIRLRRDIHRKFSDIYIRLDELFWGWIKTINEVCDELIFKIGEWEIRVEDLLNGVEKVISPEGVISEEPFFHTGFGGQSLWYDWLCAKTGIARSPKVKWNVEKDSPFVYIAWALDEIMKSNREEATEVGDAIKEELAILKEGIYITQEEALALYQDMDSEREDQGALEEENVETIKASLVKTYPEAEPKPYVESS